MESEKTVKDVQAKQKGGIGGVASGWKYPRQTATRGEWVRGGGGGGLMRK